MNLARIRMIIDSESESVESRVFDFAMQLVILVAIVTFTIETLPNLSSHARDTLAGIEAVVVVIFSVEYLLRVLCAKRKRDFVFSAFGIIDLLAILPFYLAMGVDLRWLRMLRWIRVFRALKLLRYNRALRHFSAAIDVIKEQFVLYLMATTLMIYFAAAGIYYFENAAQPEQFSSIIHAMWWSVVTLTSVGYGDVYPITTGGRIFTGLLLPVGLGVITVPAGLIAYGLTQTHRFDPRACPAVPGEDSEPEECHAALDQLLAAIEELSDDARETLRHKLIERPQGMARTPGESTGW